MDNGLTWSKGKKYRHKNCLDIDFIVENISYIGPEYIKLKLLPIHRLYKWLYPPSKVYKIKKEDFSNWELIT